MKSLIEGLIVVETDVLLICRGDGYNCCKNPPNLILIWVQPELNPNRMGWGRLGVKGCNSGWAQLEDSRHFRIGNHLF